MKKLPLSDLDRELLSRYGLDSRLLDKAMRFSYSHGEFLSREGEPLDFICFVVSGKAKVLISLSDGKQMLLAHFISDGIIGDVELMTGKMTHGSTVQVVTGFECIALPLGLYKETLRSNTIFVNHVAKELAEKLMQRAVNGAINTLQPLETRLSAYVMQSASDVDFCETLTEVALMLGCSYRHLLRSLNKLCEQGVLKKQENGYRVVNSARLAELAGDLYVLRVGGK
ncbi:MAG: cyclic nucleotide-binding domain-containing protein [Oscillospiraceae bacterium]|nr:cyclic nucleotide-binding domain-containing protein [Oscillospiraceae bacterium]MCL2279704.1 cyclic nucleotide-binding domain-containing protein [Oscillospiraceae bacterium]